MVSELLSIFSFVSEKITNLPLILHLIAVNYQLQLGDELIPIKYSITQLTSNIIPNKKAPSQKYVISLFRCPLQQMFWNTTYKVEESEDISSVSPMLN